MHYKYIFLIIDSDTHPVYTKNRDILRKILNKSDRITYFFIRSDNTLDSPAVVRGDMLYLQGTESFIPGILDKTIKAFEYCLANYDFDYIVRTNNSSFWDINVLSNRGFETVSAIMGEYYGTYYPSGSGMILPRNNVIQLVSNKHLFNYNTHDDVAIGEVMNKLNISLVSAPRYDFIYYNINATHTQETITDIVKQHPSVYHYRVKGEPARIHDNKIFEMLYNAVYEPQPS
jgi:hypothetical protein